VRLAEVVIREVEGNRSLKVFDLFAKGIREPGQAAAVHPQRAEMLY